MKSFKIRNYEKDTEAVVRRFSVKKGVLKKIRKIHSLFFDKLYQKKTLAQMFSCEFCELFLYNTFGELKTVNL